jgi:hypothetical protein
MKVLETQLWEILVPYRMGPKGRKTVPLPHHWIWDEKVRSITGGLTIFKCARGQWVDPATNVLYKEPVIPVRIACTEEQIDLIAEFTATHYKQHAVFTSLVSEKVKIFYAGTPQTEESETT